MLVIRKISWKWIGWCDFHDARKMMSQSLWRKEENQHRTRTDLYFKSTINLWKSLTTRRFDCWLLELIIFLRSAPHVDFISFRLCMLNQTLTFRFGVRAAALICLPVSSHLWCILIHFLLSRTCSWVCECIYNLWWNDCVFIIIMFVASVIVIVENCMCADNIIL